MAAKPNPKEDGLAFMAVIVMELNHKKLTYNQYESSGDYIVLERGL